MIPIGVIIGGFFGTLTRWLISVIYPASFMPGGSTLFVNVTGSFLLCLFVALSKDIIKIPRSLLVGIGTGFFGAYTTFSGFAIDIVTLGNAQMLKALVLYLGSTMIFAPFFGLGGYMVGTFINRMMKEG